jgi:hypothetical protein
VVSPRSSVAACRIVSLLVLPSLIAIVRRTCDDTAESWVTTSTVTPSSVLAVCRAENTSWAVAESSSPVGSSASSTLGWFASAVAMAARCCSPPDMRSGVRSAQCAMPRVSSRPPARRCRSRRPSELSRIGSSTFCRAVM